MRSCGTSTPASPARDTTEGKSKEIQDAISGRNTGYTATTAVK